MPEVGKEFDPHREFDSLNMPYCLMQYENLSSTAKLCWAVLKYWSHEGKTPLTQEALARELRCSQSSIEKLLKELRYEGFIKTICPTHQERLNGKPARYVFLYHQLFADNALLRKGVSPEENPKLVENIKKRAAQKREPSLIIPEDSMPMILAKLFYERIRERDPKFKEPNFQSWAKIMSAIIFTDRNGDDKEVEEVLEWSQKEPFWNKNILHPKKLREKYSTLYQQMKAPLKSNNNRQGNWIAPTPGKYEEIMKRTREEYQEAEDD